MSGAAPNVVYVVPDKTGGMLNIVASFVAHRSGPMPHHVILTGIRFSADTRWGLRMAGETRQAVRCAL